MPGSPGPCSTRPPARDGVVAPLPASPVRITTRGVPGAVRPHGHARDRRGRGPRCPAPGGRGRASRWRRPPLAKAVAGNGASGGNGVGRTVAATAARRTRPRSLRWPVPVDAPALPAPDSSSLRLVSARRLYDQGVLVGACRSLAPLAAPGDGAGQSLRPRTPRRRGRGSGAGPLVAPRAGARGRRRRGGAARGGLHRLQPRRRTTGTSPPGASALIDVREPVVDVRIETL